MNHPYLLTANTHNHLFQLGLQDSDGKRIFFESKISQRLSSTLLPSIQEFLKRNKSTIHDIDCFSIIKGPGSLTGIRIGMIVFKTLSFLSQKPCYGLNLLRIISFQAPLAKKTLSLIQAHKNYLYSQVFDHKNNPLRKPQCTSLEKTLTDGEKYTHIVTLGVESHREKIKKLAHKNTSLIHCDNKNSTHLNTMLNQTALIKKNKKKSSYQTLTPLYVFSKKY